ASTRWFSNLHWSPSVFQLGVPSVGSEYGGYRSTTLRFHRPAPTAVAKSVTTSAVHSSSSASSSRRFVTSLVTSFVSRDGPRRRLVHHGGGAAKRLDMASRCQGRAADFSVGRNCSQPEVH